MTFTQPSCLICHTPMRRNGTTSKGTQRWRCPGCGATTTQPNTTAITAAHFRLFIDWLLSPVSLADKAHQHGYTRQTLSRWFEDFWLVHVPATHDHTVYDQLFIDGTYFNNNCLLVASTCTHVIAWRWCSTENTSNYQRLLATIPAPRVVTTDGHHAALSAIKKTWPESQVQRCLVHVKRNIQTSVTLNPRTPAGKALRRLSLDLLKVRTPHQATNWIAHLHQFYTVFATWLDERTYINEVPADQIPRFARHNKQFWYTHYKQRSAYRLLERLTRSGELFRYVFPPHGCGQLKATTNSLEGGINAQIKNLLHQHRGLSAEHQRIMCDWWLYLHTQHPHDPVSIAREQNWGQNALTKARTLAAQEHDAIYETGQPRTYDNAIPTEYNHSVGIRKGHVN